RRRRLQASWALRRRHPPRPPSELLGSVHHLDHEPGRSPAGGAIAVGGRGAARGLGRRGRRARQRVLGTRGRVHPSGRRLSLRPRGPANRRRGRAARRYASFGRPRLRTRTG
ncbi:unnamed protein product, partial [Ectocarpus sp. 12 AP-2014]